MKLLGNRAMGIILPAITALMISVPDASASQEISEEPVYWLDEIVVTATRSKRSIKDLSATVSIVTREDIESSSAGIVLDLLKELPGVFVSKQETFGRADISVRGMGDNGRKIMVLVDGRPVKMGIFGCTITHSLPLDNVERIEVVRGPSSVLYGSDALGGVVNVITKSAERKTEGGLKISYGAYDTRQFLARFGGKSGRFDYYLTGGRKLSDGHRLNGGYGSWDYTAKAGYTLNGQLKTTFLGKYFHGNKREPGPISSPTPDAWDDYERYAFDLSLSGKIGGSEGYFKLYRNSGEHKFSDDFHSKDFTNGAIISISTKLIPTYEITGGIEFRNMGGEQLSDIDFADKGNWDRTESAVYIRNEYRVITELVLSAGARFNHDSVSGDELLPHLGLVYHLDPNTALRLAGNKGFRSPQINELYLFIPANPDLKPEKVWNFEAGVDRRLSDELSIDLAAYYMDGQNIIEKATNPNPPPMYKFVNSGDFTFKGAELGIRFDREKGPYGKLYYSYMDPGEKTAGRPRDRLNLILGYRMERTSLLLSSRYVTGLYAQDNSEDKLPDYFVADAKLTFKLNHNFDLFVSAENVLDKDYEIEKGYPMPGRNFSAGVWVRL